MDKKVLLEYADVQQEVKDLRRRIEKDEQELARLKKTLVADTVTCGKKGRKPIKTVKIQGMPSTLVWHKQRALEKYKKKLETKEIEFWEMLNDVENCIESVEKSEMRMIFRLFYLDDLNYIQVAERMNEMHPNKRRGYTDESIRKKIQRFFENVPQCPV